MPQLPSGCHFAINAESLDKLFKRVLEGFRVHELMAITSLEHLLNYIDVLYFRPADDAASEKTVDKTVEGSAPLPKGLVPYPSGFTAGSIQAEIAVWPKTDRDAFLAFFELDRNRVLFESLLMKVRERQDLIRDEGPFAARLQALWWEAGIHPLQPSEGDPEAAERDRTGEH